MVVQNKLGCDIKHYFTLFTFYQNWVCLFHKAIYKGEMGVLDLQFWGKKMF